MSARGGLRRYENFPTDGDVTWWWWLEFDDGTSIASGSDTRAGAITDARAAARRRGLATVTLTLCEPRALRLRGGGVEGEPHDDEHDHEHDAAEDGRDEARQATDEQRD